MPTITQATGNRAACMKMINFQSHLLETLESVLKFLGILRLNKECSCNRNFNLKKLQCNFFFLEVNLLSVIQLIDVNYIQVYFISGTD